MIKGKTFSCRKRLASLSCFAKASSDMEDDIVHPREKSQDKCNRLVAGSNPAGGAKMSSKSQIIFCNHCHNKTSHVILYKAKGISEVIDFFDGAPFEVESYYLLAKCNSCSEISLYVNSDFADEVENLQDAKLLYPKVKKYNKSVPQIIIENYTEAKRVYNISPIAFAVLIRRCLEYICKEQKALGQNLVQQLNDLAKRDVIPPTLSKMSAVLRFFGNMGAHATDSKLDHSDAIIIDDFFTTILEYVYVAPFKLEKVQKVIDEKR